MPRRTAPTTAESSWNERRSVGIYKQHSRKCPRSRDRKPRGRCDCPFWVQVGRGATRRLPPGGTLDDARAALAELRLSNEQDARPLSAPPDSIGELAARYLESRQHLKRATIRADAQSFGLAAARFGDLPIHALTATAVREWETKLIRRGLSHRTVSRAVLLLKAICAYAGDRERRWLQRSPLADYKPARSTRPEGSRAKLVLRRGEIEEVLDSARTLRDRAMIRAGVELLLRNGEASALTWRDVDLERGAAQIAWTVWRFPDRDDPGVTAYERQIVKGHQEQRLPLSNRLASELGELRAAAFAAGAGLDDFVWPSPRDRKRPVSQSTPTDVLRSAIRAANRKRAERADRALHESEQIPTLSFHGLRHTGVTELIESGVPLARVSQFARHKDPRVTTMVYTHLSQDGLDEISDFWSSRPSG